MEGKSLIITTRRSTYSQASIVAIENGQVVNNKQVN